jgi:hypothetical protein
MGRIFTPAQADLDTGTLDPMDNPLRPSRFKEGLGKKGMTLMSH